MKLTMHHYPVRSLSWGASTQYKDGHLSVNKEELLHMLNKKGLLTDVEIEDIQLIQPHTSVRVVNIFDVFAARCRLGQGAVNYPGVLGPLQLVGNGQTATLDHFAVLAVSRRINRYNKILDMSGPGSEVTPYASFYHIALLIKPKCAQLEETKYHTLMKKIGLHTGCYLAQVAATTPPDRTTYYSLEGPVDQTKPPMHHQRPRVAYVCMLSSHQRSAFGEPVLYGDDVSGLLPTVIHPNEFLDGAVIAPVYNLGIDTYSFQNNPVILNLYRRHTGDVDFAGVVVCVAHITRDRRERTVQMAANLVKNILMADAAVLTKVGGGIPESDLLAIVKILEENQVATTPIIWAHWGDGTLEDSLSVTSPLANAVVSVGINEEWLSLSAQKQVIGGGVPVPYIAQSEDDHVLSSALQVHYRDVCGAINQLGSSKVSLVEY